MFLIVLPNILQNHGLFLYTGDYAVQQIPFYYHAADYVKEYKSGWDWYTDLGSDFLTSYSYYLTGSVFFWLISWLQGSVIIYVMPVMIAFKTAAGALGAYLYIRLYVKNDNASFIGAFLYAFSGFQMTSLIYNTFHDITALFPFLLLTFDLLVMKNQKVLFGVMVAIIALTNYYFFTGIVIFVAIYYAVKCIAGAFKFSVRNFLSIIFESLLGTGIAAVILIPTFLLLINTDRVGDILYGADLISYSDNSIVPKIIQSMFLIPDPCAGGMLFKSEVYLNNWSSASLYLPLFTVTGVGTFIKNNKKNWVSKLLILCLIIAVVPGLNSAFSMFNAGYYARWFYMPVLIMCMATSKVLEDDCDLTEGIKFSAVGLIILALLFCLPDKVISNSDDIDVLLGKKTAETEIRWFSLSEAPVLFWQCMAFSAIFLLIIYVYNHEKYKIKHLLKKITFVMIAFTVVVYTTYINSTISQTEFDAEKYYEAFIDYTPDFKDDDTFRISHVTTNVMNNFSMAWGYMNAGGFHSTESNESDDFYFGAQGKARRTASQYSSDDYPAYSLLSVKYILNLSTGDDLNVEIFPTDLSGCSLYDKQGCYYIYKNDCFIPFGFMYDYCIDDNTLESYLDKNIDEKKYQYKKLSMLRALVLDEKDIEKYSDYIKPLPEEMLNGLDESTYISDCNDRRAEACTHFKYTSEGYSAKITTDKQGLVFFSVPCSKGWKASVNGKDAEIIKAHYGLTAVAVETGDNIIEFFYKTPGLAEGKLISMASLLLYAVYMIITILKGKGILKNKFIIQQNLG